MTHQDSFQEQPQPGVPPENTRTFYLLGYLFSAVLVTLWAAFQLISGGQNPKPLPDDLLLISGTSLGIILLFLALLLAGLIPLIWFKDKLEKRILGLLDLGAGRGGLVLAAFGLLLYEAGGDLLFLSAEIPAGHYQNYLMLLSAFRPVLVWMFWISLFGSLTLLALNFTHLAERTFRDRKFRAGILVGTLILGAAGLAQAAGWGFIAYSQFPSFEKAVGTFEPANAPLPGLHILLVFGLILLAARIIERVRTRYPAFEIGKKKAAGLILGLVLLWAVGFWLWKAVPVEGNYFIDVPESAAGYSYAPTSDAFYYEKQAQMLLAGEGFEADVSHPAYPSFLGLLHWVGGDSYAEILPFQIAVLALTPAALVLLGRAFGSPLAGWLMGSFFLIRERNALLLGDKLTVSNAQELMTEPLALLVLVCYLLAVYHWLQAAKLHWRHPVLAGSLIGLAVLVRIEAAAVLLLTIPFAWLILKLPRPAVRKSLVLFTAAAGLVLLPWVVRSQAATGRWIFDKAPDLRRSLRSYVEAGNQPDVSRDSYSSEEPASLPRPPARFMLPILHFSSSMQHALLYLPSNHQPLLTAGSLLELTPEPGGDLISRQGWFSEPYLSRYVKSLPYWRYTWDGQIRARSLMPLMLISLLIGSGIRESWRKVGLISLLPGAAFLIHAGVYAVYGRSGGRYIKILDWVSLFYFSLGLAAAAARFLDRGSREPGPNPRVEMDTGTLKNFLSARFLTAIQSILPLLILLGSTAVPVLERSLPEKYSRVRGAEVLRAAAESSRPESSRFARAMLAEQVSMIYGKALYPRFFTAKQQIPDDYKGTLPRSGAARLDFFLVGTENIWVSLPIEKPPEILPHGTVVLVSGHLTRDDNRWLAMGYKPYFQADQVAVVGGTGEVLVRMYSSQ